MNNKDDIKFFTDFQTKMFDKFGYTLDKLNPTMNFWWYHPLKQEKLYREIGYHNYHLHYAPRFNPLRNKVKKVLEIGVFRGHSMLMWQDYFPNAQIYGVDINYSPHNFGKNAYDICRNEPRIKLFEMDACNPTNVKTLMDEIGNDFDIIIDDGSHHPVHQLFSTLHYTDYLKEDGIFVVEDVFMSEMFDKNTFLDYYDTPYQLYTEDKYFFDEILTNDKDYNLINMGVISNMIEDNKLNEIRKKWDIQICNPISYMLNFKDIDLKGNNKKEHYNNRQGIIFFKKKNV